MKDVYLSQEMLQQLLFNKFRTSGLSLNQCVDISKHLAYADAKGATSHGSMRLNYYLKRINSGGTTLDPQIEYTYPAPSICIIDGKNGTGFHIAQKGIEKGIKIAQKYGIAIIGMKNMGHCGTLSYYLEQVTSANMIALSFTQSDPMVLPPNGLKPYFGTNPFGYGIPNEDNPIIFDMATTTVAWGKVLIARNNNEKIPLDWGLDENYQQTDDPFALKYLIPMANYKGFGLMMMIDILAGSLLNLDFGQHVSTMYGDLSKGRGLGSMQIILNPSFFGDETIFKQKIKLMLEELSNMPNNGQEVQYPGSNTLKIKQLSKLNGIKVNYDIYQKLIDTKKGMI